MTAPDDVREILYPELLKMKKSQKDLEEKLSNLVSVPATGSVASRSEEAMNAFERFVNEHRTADPEKLRTLLKCVVRRVELSFRMKPGTEGHKRHTFEINEGTMALQCPLPSSTFSNSSKKLNGKSKALIAIWIPSFKNSCVCFDGLDS